MKEILITTQRLVIRQISRDDADFIRQHYNEASFLEYIGDKKIQTADDAIAYIVNGPLKSYQQHGFGLFLVTLKESNIPIGTCGLIRRENIADADLGYSLLEKFRSQGYSSEAASAVLDFGKNVVGLNRVVAYTAPLNKASIRVLEKLGFEYEGELMLAGYDGTSKLFAIKL